jgi:hypothetical protein
MIIALKTLICPINLIFTRAFDYAIILSPLLSYLYTLQYLEHFTDQNMADTELDRLEHLNLVSRIITELENHFGLNNKEVAEFIIELARNSVTFDKFKKALEEHDLADGVSHIPFQ